MNIRSLFPQSIAGRLTLWFLLTTLIPSFLLVTTMFLMIRSAVEQAASEQLEYVMKDRVGKSRVGSTSALGKPSFSPTVRCSWRPARLATLRQSQLSRRQDRQPPEPAPPADRRYGPQFGSSLTYDNFLVFDTQTNSVFALRPGLPLSSALNEGPLRDTPPCLVLSARP